MPVIQNVNGIEWNERHFVRFVLVCVCESLSNELTVHAERRKTMQSFDLNFTWMR